MDVSLDITKLFNEEIDYCPAGGEAESTIFLKFPVDIRGRFDFNLINFYLNLDKQLDDQLRSYGHGTAYITECQFKYKRLFVFGCAQLTIDGVKGADASFSLNSDRTKGWHNHTWDYKLSKGDRYFMIGGRLFFIPAFLTIIFIGSPESRATITISLDESQLIDSYDSSAVVKLAKFHTPRFSSIRGKMFEQNFCDKYFGFDGKHEAIYTAKTDE